MERLMKLFLFFSHFAQHLYIGAAPLLFPLVKKELSLSYLEIGLTLSLRTFFAGFFQLFYPALRKHITRKQILNLSNMGQMFSTFGMALSSSFSQFLLFNIFWGLSTSPIHPVINSFTKGGLTVGSFYGYAYFGNIVGAVMVFLLCSIGWKGVLLTMAFLKAVLFICTVFVSEDVQEYRRDTQGSIIKTISDRRIIITCSLGILLFGATNCFIRHLIPLYLTHQFRISIEYASSIFILISLTAIISPLFFGWLSRRVKEERLLTIIAILLFIFFFVASHCQKIGLAITLLILQSFLAWPLLALFHLLLLKRLEPELRETGTSILLTVNITSFIIWANLFGTLLDISSSFFDTLYLISILCIVSVLISICNERLR
jgi:MFS family permease